MNLGTYIATTVIRHSGHANKAHGYVYMVDLDQGTYECKIAWDESDIDWKGRGRQRGLRGIAFHQDKVLIAAHNRVLVYTPGFELIQEIGCPVLSNLHEIWVEGDLLYITSTGYNSIIVYDFSIGKFTHGYWLSNTVLGKNSRKLGLRPKPKMKPFDPAGDSLPPRGGHLHINTVSRDRGRTLVSGTKMGWLMAIEGDRMFAAGKIPYLTHNARVYQAGIICNDTSQHRIARLDTELNLQEVFDTPRVDTGNIVFDENKKVIAVDGFARGLVLNEDGLIVGGSSPASVSAYRSGSSEPVKTVRISEDVHNAVHGLERWPF